MRYRGVRGAITTLALLALGPAHAVAAHKVAPAGATAAVDGFSREGLLAIQDLMDNAVREGKIPSAISMLARDGKIVWIATAGEMGPGHPMRDDAIMPLASQPGTAYLYGPTGASCEVLGAVIEIASATTLERFM